MQSQSSKQANAQSMTYNEATGMHYSGEYTVKTVPDAIAASIQPTAPCAIPLTGSGSGVGFGLSLGSAYVDKGCEIREDIRLGMSGDEESRRLANKVLHSRLKAHLNEGDEDEVVSVSKKDADNDGAANFFGLTSY